jgi:hypothetical protein
MVLYTCTSNIISKTTRNKAYLCTYVRTKNVRTYQLVRTILMLCVVHVSVPWYYTVMLQLCCRIGKGHTCARTYQVLASDYTCVRTRVRILYVRTGTIMFCHNFLIAKGTYNTTVLARVPI